MSAPLSIHHLFGRRRLRRLLAFFWQPTHHPAQLCADDLNRMLLLFLAYRIELMPAALILRNPFARELATLNVGQRLLHRRPRGIAHNLLAARQIAIFRRVRNGIPHPAQPAFVNQIDDQLHFMQALEISNLRRVPGLDQRLESLLNQRRQPAAQHRLLAEQVALSFFLESSLQHSRARRANAVCISQREFMRMPARILLNRNQRRHSAPFGINTPHQMPRTLRSDHHHVHVGGRNNRLEMNAEAVRDPENLSRMQIRLDELFIRLSLRLVRREDLDPVGALGGLIRRHHDHAVSPRRCGAWPVRGQPNDHLIAAVAKILRLRVSLTAVTNNGDRLALQYLRLRVAFVENSNHRVLLSTTETAYRPVGRYIEMLPAWAKSVKSEL